MNSDNPKKNKTTWLFVLLLLITFISVGISIWALFVRESMNGTLVPDYALQEEEKYAEPIGENEEKLEHPNNGGAVSLIYSTKVKVNLSTQKVNLKFVNPSRSVNNMIIQIKIQDEVIAQSGLVVSGNQLTMLDLLESIVERLKEGGYEGVMKIFYYDPNTGEKAVISTEIPIQINVTN